MARDKWERAKERFTDWFDYNYDRTVRRSPDARSAYEERIETREQYWREQQALKVRRQLEHMQRKELEIQNFLDEKLPLVPSPTGQRSPVRDGKGGPVRVYVPTGAPGSLAAAGRGGPHGFGPDHSSRIPAPRGYFMRHPGRRRRYTSRLGTLSELEEEGDHVDEVGSVEKILEDSDAESRPDVEKDGLRADSYGKTTSLIVRPRECIV
ncbi:hypothetical protein GGTG_12182 [Gaeumannomyces tritici R3-111a-1]|uniref:Uncharacterized protein n=1 Tax=Gaeumannomyces tritici (strain R3-111a-1) TaxID=644352 RepID=J3PFA3_GAET3|nr:hypothetical protein GGTG_12182 [Gaeumannomyces tritici R3-111a-1]EJT70005.1 hypothetical protein GGTG_12182 [Gaeumannomyces tritici R3-111a-1]